MKSKLKLIVLDRDGVINQDSDHYIKCPDEWIPYPDSLKAIGLLKKAGYTIAVATNQSGIGRGYYDHKMLAKMHHKMQTLLAEYGGSIDYITYCPHHPDEGCDCRKPRSGMLLKIADKFQINPKKVTMVGDTLGDLNAAKGAGMSFVFVRSGKGQRTLKNNPLPIGTVVFDNLSSYVNELLKK